MSPKVTVLLPVYNGESFLAEAIQSILGQTFSDFELLIIDDGSTDRSFEIMSSFQDPRVKIVKNDKNLKLIATLNKGMKLARGEYIARMDADDISLPTRLQLQVDFLEDNPGILIVGGWSEVFGGTSRIRKVPELHEEIQASLLFSSMLIHPSLMFRRQEFLNNNYFYSEEAKHVEDYELWARVLKKYKAHNLQEIVLRYRKHDSKIGIVYSDTQKQNSAKIRSSLLRELGVNQSEDELKLHENLSYWSFKDSIEDVDLWLFKIADANSTLGMYSNNALHKVLLDKWGRVFRKSKLSYFQKLRFLALAKFPDLSDKIALLIKPN